MGLVHRCSKQQQHCHLQEGCTLGLGWVLSLRLQQHYYQQQQQQ
jgi:hypothetical protein